LKSVLVHDWLVSPIGGGEKSLQAIHQLFPSPIYTLLKNEKKLKNSYFEGTEIFTSFIQNFPFANRLYRNLLPLFPIAIEQFDLSAYDLVISSSHCVAKGVICSPDQLHICYCYTPVRYAWDMMNQYLLESGLTHGVKGALVRLFLHYIRGWDSHSAHRVDHFIAISHYVARRIQKFYGRKAEVIYPPVDISYYQPGKQKDDFYLTFSRFVPYKRIDLIVEAFSEMPDKRLVVIGSGPEEKKILSKAKKNIEFLGYQPDEVLRSYLQRAKGFVFAALEDFGIAPVEAMACGTPVIGLGKGALRETVIEGRTGVFFPEQTTSSIKEAICNFEKMEMDPLEIRRQAEKFSLERFNIQFAEFVSKRYGLFKESIG
jgi:glycosyltransferase involved in cell wall biosynthesis